MTIRNEVAGIAGGTLGYIVGNAPGAIRGYYLGKTLSKHSNRMAPIPRKRRASNASQFGGPANKRWSSTTSFKFKAKHRSKGGGSGPGAYRNSGSNASAMYKRGPKGVAHKKRKQVKVSRKFKLKVHKALDEEIRGKYLKVMYRRMAPPALQNSQQTLDDAQTFTPLDFADAADVLFNRAAALEVPTAVGLDWQNVYIRKDRILNSWCTHEAKNVSQRTYTLKMYVCKPRTKTPTNNQPDDAFADWVIGLQVANGAGTNPINNTPNTLYSVPTDSPQFAQLWKAECTTVVLQPGQSHTFFVQGPSDYVLDYSKYVNRSILGGPDYIAPWGPFTRNIFFVAYADLTTSTLAGSGRMISGGAGVGGIVFEKKLFFSMACPESAGFIYPVVVAGLNQQLTNKLPCKVIANFSAGVVGVVQDILEENPIAPLDPLD